MRRKSELGKSQTEDAIREFGATRLSAIIFCLRERGYDIETQIEVSKNRYGRNVEFARYILHE